MKTISSCSFAVCNNLARWLHKHGVHVVLGSFGRYTYHVEAADYLNLVCKNPVLSSGVEKCCVYSFTYFLMGM